MAKDIEQEEIKFVEHLQQELQQLSQRYLEYGWKLSNIFQRVSKYPHRWIWHTEWENGETETISSWIRKIHQCLFQDRESYGYYIHRVWIRVLKNSSSSLLLRLRIVIQAEPIRHGGDEESKNEMTKSASTITTTTTPSTEPAWARDKTDPELRSICRVLKVPGYTGMNRTTMIASCNLMDVENKTRAQLVGLSIAQLPLNEPHRATAVTNIRKLPTDRLVKRVVDHKVNIFHNELEKKYDNLSCPPPLQKPTVRNDTFNDCPPFFRRNSTNDCCEYSAKAKTKARLRAPITARVLYTHFQDSMNIQKRVDLEKELQKSQIPDKERSKLMNEYDKAEKETSRWLQKQNLGKHDYAFVVGVGQVLRRYWERAFDEALEALKESETLDDQKIIKGQRIQNLEKITTKQEDKWSQLLGGVQSALGTVTTWSKYILTKVFSIAGWAFQQLISIGFNVMTYIFKHPRTAKLMAYLALQIKKQLCREISIALGKYRYKKAQGWFDSVKEAAKDNVLAMYEYVTVIAPGLVSDFIKSPKFDALFTRLSGVITTGFTAVLTLVPFVGPYSTIVTSILQIAFAALKDSSRDAIDVAMYKTDVSGSFSYVIELLDFRQCIAEQEITEEEMVIRRDKPIIENINRNVISQVIDLLQGAGLVKPVT